MDAETGPQISPSAGSVARVPAADIEAVVVKLLKENLAKQERSITSNVLSGDRGAVAQLLAGIVVSEDRLVVRLKSENADESSDSPDDQSHDSLAKAAIQKTPPDPAPA